MLVGTHTKYIQYKLNEFILLYFDSCLTSTNFIVCLFLVFPYILTEHFTISRPTNKKLHKRYERISEVNFDGS